MNRPARDNFDNAVHIMIDIETLGLRPDSVVVSIGACRFWPVDEQGNPVVTDPAHFILSTEFQVQKGRYVDPETMLWWSKQDPAASSVVNEAVRKQDPYYMSLTAFDTYLLDQCDGEAARLRIWADGAGFDPVILQSLYATNSHGEAPWPWWSTRCYRTLRAHVPAAKLGEDKPTIPHHAMNDAIAQARNASRWLSWLTKAAEAEQ